jgi:hypothetical protein
MQNGKLLYLADGRPGKISKAFSVFMCKYSHTLDLNLTPKISLQIRGFSPPKL